MQLYSFWRSVATFRVRIALNLKGLKPEVISLDLLRGDQHEAAFGDVNPQRMVPALVDGEGPALFQSLAIVEYLDETRPNPPLLPKEPRARARVRGLAQIVVSDAHPLIVPRVRNYLERDLGLDEATRTKWIQHWLTEACRAVEAHLARDAGTGRFSHGDAVTLADVCLVPHVVSCRVYGCDLTPYPTLTRIADTCLALEPFAAAHPLKQPGAPATAVH